MDRSVAQGRPPGPAANGRPTTPGQATPGERWAPLLVGILLAVAALAIYLTTRVDRFYDHFVWQAAAFLEGQAAIRYPVVASAESVGNAFFQDVLRWPSDDGTPRGLLPFPPLPALLLVPFVAAFGLATDDQTLFTILAAVDVAICWWMIGRLGVGPVVRLATTVFFAFGTVFWYTAQLATTWYQAHIVAVGLTMLAVGLAVGHDREALTDERASGGDDRAGGGDERAGGGDERAGGGDERVGLIDGRQFLVGLLFGLAACARLPIVVGAPFFMFVGSGGSWSRRSWSAGLGALIPVALLLAYNVVSSGQPIHPAYDHLYRLETRTYPALGYQRDWALEDPRYLPQNLGIMLLTPPIVHPATLPDSLGVRATPVCTDPSAERGLFDLGCPLAVPNDIGMSVLLTSPAYLLAIPALGRFGRVRVVTGATLAVVPIVIVNLMHFSQGWVQFGYRFANDAVPFALPLVALGFARLVGSHGDTPPPRRAWAMPLGMALVVASVAVNAWGVIWGTLLGW